MSRKAPFNEEIARGLLAVIGRAGYSLGEVAEGEESEEVSADLALKRLLALVELATQAEEESPSAEPPAPELPSHTPAEEAPAEAVSPETVSPETVSPETVSPETVPAEPSLAEPVATGWAREPGELPAVPEPNPWSLALAGAEEPARQLPRWLQQQLAAARRVQD